MRLSTEEESFMKNILIISKDRSEKNMKLISSVIHAIEQRGANAKIMIEPAPGEREQVDVPEDTECVITVGGDGTLIRAASRTLGSNVPLLGVNTGHLGYLCDLDKDSVYSAIDRLLSDDFEVEDRMMISGGIEGEPIRRCALNDIVIASSNPSQVISLTIHVNGQLLYSFNGDGVILATPTGSTAYNLSAGGPIVDPLTQVILVTPINPHSFNSRSIVFGAEDVIKVGISPRRKHTKENAVVSFDGGHKLSLSADQKIVVKRASDLTRMVRLSEMNFLERLSRKIGSESSL